MDIVADSIQGGDVWGAECLESHCLVMSWMLGQHSRSLRSRFFGNLHIGTPEHCLNRWYISSMVVEGLAMWLCVVPRADTRQRVLTCTFSSMFSPLLWQGLFSNGYDCTSCFRCHYWVFLLACLALFLLDDRYFARSFVIVIMLVPSMFVASGCIATLQLPRAFHRTWK